MSSNWTYFSNHLHVLIAISRDPDARVRDLTEQVGITERAIHRVLSELVEVGALKKERVGRRTHYVINRKAPLRHPLEDSHTVGELIDAIA